MEDPAMKPELELFKIQWRMLCWTKSINPCCGP